MAIISKNSYRRNSYRMAIKPIFFSFCFPIPSWQSRLQPSNSPTNSITQEHSLRISVVIELSATGILDLMQKQSIPANRNFLFPVIHRSLEPSFCHISPRWKRYLGGFPVPMYMHWRRCGVGLRLLPGIRASAHFIPQFLSAVFSSSVAKFMNENIQVQSSK